MGSLDAPEEVVGDAADTGVEDVLDEDVHHVLAAHRAGAELRIQSTKGERERGGWLVTVIELRSQLPFMGRDERVKPGSVREEGADAPWRSPPA